MAERNSAGGALFSRLSLVGVGLIGGSVGLAAQERGLAEEIIGVDPDSEALAQAVKRGAIDRGTPDLAEGVAGAELVILASPIPALLELLPRLAPLLAPGALVSDVASVKGAVAGLAQAGPDAPGACFVPGHPMAGSERHGVAAARSDLFVGATWALTPTAVTAPAAVEALSRFVSGLGAVPLILSPEEHDRYVAITSHVPHVLAYALYALARRQGENSPLWQLAAGGFHSTTRVAASSPEMWAGICLSNRENVTEELRHLRENLNEVLAALEAGDREALLPLFQAGHRK